MAISQGETVNATPVTSSAGSISVSVSTSGSNRGLAIAVGWGHNSATPDLAASNPITYNGVAATVERCPTLGTFEASAVAFLADPATGSNTLTVTFASNVDIAWLAAIPLNGTVGALSIRTQTGADAATVDVTSNSGDLVFDSLMDGNSTTNVSDQTAEYETNSLGGYWSGGMGSAAGASPDVTMSWTNTVSPRITAMSIQEAAGGGGSSPSPIFETIFRAVNS